MEHWSYSVQLGPLASFAYMTIFVYGVVAVARDLHRLLVRWLG